MVRIDNDERWGMNLLKGRISNSRGTQILFLFSGREIISEEQSSGINDYDWTEYS